MLDHIISMIVKDHIGANPCGLAHECRVGSMPLIVVSLDHGYDNVQINLQILFQVLAGPKVHLVLVGDRVSHLDPILMDEVSTEGVMYEDGLHILSHKKGI